MYTRFGEVYNRFAELDQKLDRRFGDLDRKVDRQFTWLVGTQVAVLLAMVGALIGAFYR
jgi:hypothetical protein